MEIPYNAASQTFETFSDPVFLGALNNIVYIQSSVVNQVTHIVFNRLYALQASTGKQLWSFQQQPSNLTWTTFNINAGTGVISIQGLDAHNPTDVYLLRATDGRPLGSVIQSQEVNNVLIANGTVYITSIAGDGNNTPFTYHVRALQPDNQGGKTLWGFGA
jgi:outer membrane protein assembly factor BamB